MPTSAPAGTAGPLLSVVGGVVNAVATAVTIAFLAIFMLIFGDRVMPGNIVAEERESYEW